MKAKEKSVDTFWGSFAIVVTLVTSLLFAAAFATEYEGKCEPSPVNGEPSCSNRFAWKGFGGVPIEPLASAFSTCMGAYISFRSIKKNESSLPSGDS